LSTNEGPTTRVADVLVVERFMSDRELNDWRLLRDQFDALMRRGSDEIEDILDAQFRRRFSELIERQKNRFAREAS